MEPSAIQPATPAAGRSVGVRVGLTEDAGDAAPPGWRRYEGCFGCGAANPIGLHLCGAVAASGPHAGRYVMPVHLPVHYQGGPGVLHGGIQAVVLDEVLGQAIHVLAEIADPIVTADFTVRYRRPAPTDTDLVAVGWIEQQRGPWFMVAGCIADATGIVLTDATARWRRLPAPS